MNDSTIDITPSHKKMVESILKKYLHTHGFVWVFGSRAKNRAKKFSDLDLAIDMGEPIPKTLLTNILFELEESDLPYKVDVIDWNHISDNFKKHIENDRVLFCELG